MNFKPKYHSIALLILFLCLHFTVFCQGPVARFTFNNGSLTDDVSGLVAKNPGTLFVRDRFGNENSAIFLSGNKYSYINLGSSERLKPTTATISFWVHLDNPVYSGKGANYNPLIITKYTPLNDYYEAYAVYYMINTKRLLAVSSEDSVREVCAHSKELYKLNTWNHVVLIYDYNSLSLYLNGELQQTSLRKMPVFFMPEDSVVMGSTANVKNERFSTGTFDDVEFYNRILSDQEILDLYHAPNPNRSRVLFNWILMFVAFVVLILVIYFLIRYQLSRTLKKEKEKLELNNILLENELRVIRASMNPHFIFNSLNGLQSLILKNENEVANVYLVKFSRLVRSIIENNASDVISLDLEMEMISNYVSIENLRFEEKISLEINVVPPLVLSMVQVPIMMLQPFVENAIWHGLLEKKGEKNIRIGLELCEENYVLCVIDDNGNGRRSHEAAPGIKKSLATLFIMQRLELLNKINNLHSRLEIIDKPDAKGTIIKIMLPVK